MRLFVGPLAVQPSTPNVVHPSTYRAEINRAIKHTGLKVVAAASAGRTLGYSYFTDLKTGYQVGDSVYVNRQTQLTVSQWVTEAEQAAKARNPIPSNEMDTNSPRP